MKMADFVSGIFLNMAEDVWKQACKAGTVKPEDVLSLRLRHGPAPAKDLLRKVESLGYVYEVYERDAVRHLETNPQFNILAMPK